MERWLYKNGTADSYSISVPEISGRLISGRIYRDGVEFRPSANEGTAPPDPARKEFRREINGTEIFFAFPLNADEAIDIPYQFENNQA